MWCERCVKKELRRLNRQEDNERHRNHRLMEIHLYERLYDILRSDAPETETFRTLQRIKAKIVRLQASEKAKILLNTNDHDKMDSKESSLYHVLKMRRLHNVRKISHVQDSHGYTYATPNEITNNL